MMAVLSRFESVVVCFWMSEDACWNVSFVILVDMSIGPYLDPLLIEDIGSCGDVLDVGLWSCFA